MSMQGKHTGEASAAFWGSWPRVLLQWWLLLVWVHSSLLHPATAAIHADALLMQLEFVKGIAEFGAMLRPI